MNDNHATAEQTTTTTADSFNKQAQWNAEAQPLINQLYDMAERIGVPFLTVAVVSKRPNDEGDGGFTYGHQVSINVEAGQDCL